LASGIGMSAFGWLYAVGLLRLFRWDFHIRDPKVHIAYFVAMATFLPWII